MCGCIRWHSCTESYLHIDSQAVLGSSRDAMTGEVHYEHFLQQIGTDERFHRRSLNLLRVCELRIAPPRCVAFAWRSHGVHAFRVEFANATRRVGCAHAAWSSLGVFARRVEFLEAAWSFRKPCGILRTPRVVLVGVSAKAMPSRDSFPRPVENGPRRFS